MFSPCDGKQTGDMDKSKNKNQIMCTLAHTKLFVIYIINVCPLLLSQLFVNQVRYGLFVCLYLSHVPGY